MRQHFVSFIKDKHLDATGLKCSSLNHVENSSWSATDNVCAVFEFENVVIYISTSDATMNFHLHVVTKCKTNLLSLFREFPSWRKNQNLRFSERNIQILETSQTKDTRLASS